MTSGVAGCSGRRTRWRCARRRAACLRSDLLPPRSVARRSATRVRRSLGTGARRRHGRTSTKSSRRFRRSAEVNAVCQNRVRRQGPRRPRARALALRQWAPETLMRGARAQKALANGSSQRRGSQRRLLRLLRPHRILRSKCRQIRTWQHTTPRLCTRIQSARGARPRRMVLRCCALVPQPRWRRQRLPRSEHLRLRANVSARRIARLPSRLGRGGRGSPHRSTRQDRRRTPSCCTCLIAR